MNGSESGLTRGTADSSDGKRMRAAKLVDTEEAALEKAVGAAVTEKEKLEAEMAAERMAADPHTRHLRPLRGSQMAPLPTR